MKNYKDNIIFILEIFVIILLGFILIKILRKLVKYLLIRLRINTTLTSFILSITNLILYIILVIIILLKIGIPITSITTIISAIAVSIGISLKDSLSNLANGIILISTKPFKNGDYIKCGDFEGTVLRINLIHTILDTFDNKKIIVNNNLLVSKEIYNYSINSSRRLDISYKIPLTYNFYLLIDLLNKKIKASNKILKTPLSKITLTELNEFNYIITLRLWIKTDNYFDLLYEFNEFVLSLFQENNIIPIPKDLNINLLNSDK